MNYMNYDDIKNYCETIIKPFKEQLSDKALAEIEGFYKEYYFSSFDDEEDPDILSKKYEDLRKYELYDVVTYILEKHGFSVYKIEDDDDIFNV